MVLVVEAWAPRWCPHRQDLSIPHQPEDVMEPSVQGTQPQIFGLKAERSQVAHREADVADDASANKKVWSIFFKLLHPFFKQTIQNLL